MGMQGSGRNLRFPPLIISASEKISWRDPRAAPLERCQDARQITSHSGRRSSDFTSRIELIHLVSLSAGNIFSWSENFTFTARSNCSKMHLTNHIQTIKGQELKCAFLLSFHTSFPRLSTSDFFSCPYERSRTLFHLRVRAAF